MSEIIVQPKKRSSVVIEKKIKHSISISSPTLEVNQPTPKEGIAYPPKRWSGQKISFLQYDEGWRYANDEFKRVNPVNPEYFQELDYNASDPELFLKHPNMFGNYYRLTDIEGNPLTSANFIGDERIFMDHIQGCYLIQLRYPENIWFWYNLVEGYSFEGISNWSIVNQLEMYDLQPRFDVMGTTFAIWTSALNTAGNRYMRYTSRETLSTDGFPSYHCYFIKYFDQL